MKLSYAITVCNESRELYSLVSFLKKVKDPEDEINVLVDSTHVTQNVRDVLKFYEEDIIVHEREFDGDFSKHRNFHISKCSGDYIFLVDADEMPQELLIKNIKHNIEQSGGDVFSVPRINIHPGSTKEWLKVCNFRVNEVGWINWPDYNCRIFKNNPKKIHFVNSLHESITGFEKQILIEAKPELAIWHIKSIEKQYNRWKEGGCIVDTDPDLYDKLM
tara:strand:+ start:1877 stop:2530 length:654 start_codon:yes stop_codon:yes gene_type:complete